MRRNDRSSSSDPDDQRDITEQFWGGAPGWSDPRPEGVRPPLAGGVQAFKDGFAAFRPRTSADASGPIDRTRSHGIVRPSLDAVPDADDRWRTPARGSERVDLDLDLDLDLNVDRDRDLDLEDAFWGERSAARRSAPARGDAVPLDSSASRGGTVGLDAIDPLLLRIGVFVIALIVLFPLARAIRSGDGAGTLATGAATETTAPPPSSQPAAPVATVAPGSASDGSTGVDVDDVDPTPVAGDASGPASSGGSNAGQPAASDRQVQSETQSRAAATQAPEPAPAPTAASDGDLATLVIDEAATVDEPADRVVPDCSLEHVVQAGDSWYSIAAAADVTPAALIRENRATLDTVILPGDEICLPGDASVPTTTEPLPTTTEPPPTTTEPEPSTASWTTGEVQQLIRDVWPDDLEARALEIAFRESRYRHDAYNGSCCYGVFQIHWRVHRSWLAEHGVERAEDLFHARKNIEAAYALYQSAGGWSPWAQTAG